MTRVYSRTVRPESAGVRGLQLVPDAGEAARCGALHRANRAADEIGCLGFRPVLDVSEHNHSTHAWWKTANRCPHRVTEIRRLHIATRRSIRHGGHRNLANASPPPPADREIDQYPSRINLWLIAALDALPTAMDAFQRSLHEVLSEAVV